jgi:hypothetical protein
MDGRMSSDPYREAFFRSGPRPIRLSASEFEQVRAVIIQTGARVDDFFSVQLEFADRKAPSPRPIRVVLTPRA